jgi:hypothetical protein
MTWYVQFFYIKFLRIYIHLVDQYHVIFLEEKMQYKNGDQCLVQQKYSSNNLCDLNKIVLNIFLEQYLKQKIP